MGFPSPFGGSDPAFDPYDEFVPGNVPPPGEFLDGHDVLAGRRHLAVHRLARALFEERGVYDMTFGYNLARLNSDPRHPTAGYRYAVEDPTADDAVELDADDALAGGGTATGDTGDAPAADGQLRVLRAEFTPTTAFCPQSDTLTTASFRAWNGLAERHEFDLVRVRVAPMHQRSVAINGELKQLETAFCKTGEVPGGNDAERTDGTPEGDGAAGPTGDPEGLGGPTAPF